MRVLDRLESGKAWVSVQELPITVCRYYLSGMRVLTCKLPHALDGRRGVRIHSECAAVFALYAVGDLHSTRSLAPWPRRRCTGS